MQTMMLESVVRNKIINRIEHTLKLYPHIESITLTGSLTTGNYIDENSPLEVQKRKMELKGRLSDIDFITEPCVIYRDDLIDLLPKCTGTNHILIWTKEKGLLI